MTGLTEVLKARLPNRPRIELIVFGRDNLSALRPCLKTIRSLSAVPGPLRGAPHSLAVADAGSDDRTVGRLRELADQEPFRLYEGERKRGVAGAINTALKARSGADVTVLLSGDATVPPGFFDRLIAPFREHADVGIVGPLSNFARWQSVPRPKAPTGKWHHNKLPRGMKLPEFQEQLDAIWAGDRLFPRLPALSGFCLALRKQALDALGEIEEGLDWHDGGDTEFCFRAADLGFGIMLASNLMVYRAPPPKADPASLMKSRRRAEAMLVEQFGTERIARLDAILAGHPALTRLRERTLKLANAAADRAPGGT